MPVRGRVNAPHNKVASQNFFWRHVCQSDVPPTVFFAQGPSRAEAKITVGSRPLSDAYRRTARNEADCGKPIPPSLAIACFCSVVGSGSLEDRACVAGDLPLHAKWYFVHFTMTFSRMSSDFFAYSLPFFHTSTKPKSIG